jgi:AraC-like DNA-binding protein
MPRLPECGWQARMLGMRRKSFRAKTETYLSNALRTPLGTILRHGLWRNSGGPYAGRRMVNYFCFVYTIAGETVYEDEFLPERRLVPGDLVLIHPGVAHRYGNGGRGGWDEYFVLFEGPIFDLWKARKLIDPRRPIVHLEPVAYWQQRLSDCVKGEERADLASNLQRLVDLQSFMTEVIGAQAASDRTTTRPWLAQACRRLESDLAESVDWDRFAKSLGLSVNTFRKLFTQAMGIAPSRYRRAKIIDQACRLAVEGDRLGKEIAHELGFATEQHFSRCFREMTGLTLSQFRRQWIARGHSVAARIDKVSIRTGNRTGL